MKIKGIPLLYLPYTSISIKRRDRASGFLTPTFGGSGAKGARFSGAYYKTLGRSVDATFRTDIYTSRGIGVGADVRTRANSRSYLNFGFYSVKDRIFGDKADEAHPDQGGSSFYVDGVHYSPTASLPPADFEHTSNLAYRQVFLRQHSAGNLARRALTVFVNKNHGSYSSTSSRSDTR